MGFKNTFDAGVLFIIVALLVQINCSYGQSDLIAPGATVQKLAGDFKFTEGPAADKMGNVFFTDIPNNRIHKWSLDGKLSIYRENSGGANGLFFDKKGDLLVCEGNNHRVTSIDARGKVTVLAETYKGKKLNKPNDLWPDPKGGIYFTDPVYGVPVVQDGEHVYYISPDKSKVTRVIDDMVRPNGIIGTPDGKRLYVADHGGNKAWRYDINKDGTLTNKTFFAPGGSDGMTIDDQGNIYLTTSAVMVYSPKGKKITQINTPERPANVCFGGKDNNQLFITARKSLYTIQMQVHGVKQPRPKKK
ncbi:MAG: SMP-30/gluconolactonase/LRE family protein [Phycisphaerae bacterium]|nr:SMP-30/gluconolactonase/LRE family protein [Phycisphaerae bacterium]